MATLIYRYDFGTSVPLEDIEAMLVLAILGVEGLHGESAAKLDARHFLDAQTRVCIVDATCPVGRDLNRLFVTYMAREFKPDEFTVQRVDDHVHEREEAAA